MRGRSLRWWLDTATIIFFSAATSFCLGALVWLIAQEACGCCR